MKKCSFIWLFSLAFLLSACSTSDSPNPAEESAIHITAHQSKPNDGQFRHYVNSDAAWIRNNSQDSFIGIIFSEGGWGYISFGLDESTSQYQIYEYNNGIRRDIPELEGCIPSSINNSGTDGILMGFCPWEGNGQGFVKKGDQISFINSSPRIIVNSALVDESGRIHSTVYNYDSQWNPVGTPSYWIDGEIQSITLPPIESISLSLLSVNGEIKVFGKGRNNNSLELFEVSDGSTAFIHKFDQSQEGYFEVGKLRSFGDDIYWLGSYSSYHANRQGSYGFYLKNGEINIIEDPNVTFGFRDILISGDNEHLIGTATSKITGTYSSIYLLNRKWVHLSGDKNVSLTEIDER